MRSAPPDGEPRTRSRSTRRLNRMMKSSGSWCQTTASPPQISKCSRRYVDTIPGETTGHVSPTMATNAKFRSSSVACSWAERGTTTNPVRHRGHQRWVQGAPPSPWRWRAEGATVAVVVGVELRVCSNAAPKWSDPWGRPRGGGVIVSPSGTSVPSTGVVMPGDSPPPRHSRQ